MSVVVLEQPQFVARQAPADGSKGDRQRLLRQHSLRRVRWHGKQKLEVLSITKGARNCLVVGGTQLLRFQRDGNAVCVDLRSHLARFAEPT